MHRAKIALLAGTSLYLAMGFAQAAPPQQTFVDRWTGVYVGGNLGYSWGHVDSTTTVGSFTQLDTVPPSFFTFTFPGGASSNSLRPVGPIGGVQIGYTGWYAPGWLAGFEADFQWSGQKNSRRGGFFGDTTDCSSSDCSFLNTTDITAKLSYFGTVRGRIGPEFNGLWVYVTGGLAYGKLSFDVANSLVLLNNVVPFGFPPAVVGTYTNAFSFSEWLAGYAVGVGIEGLLGADGKWRWKLEYLHIELGSIGGVVSGRNPAIGVTSGTFTDDIVRVGLNYRLNGGP
jgi:outer membrane immunogenic protein